MRFISTVLGILLIIFGTLLIPFPDYYNFQKDQYTLTLKKVETKASETNASETKAPEAKPKTIHIEGVGSQTVNLTLDPLMGAISVLVGIILVFLGRRKA